VILGERERESFGRERSVRKKGIEREILFMEERDFRDRERNRNIIFGRGRNLGTLGGNGQHTKREESWEKDRGTWRERESRKKIDSERVCCPSHTLYGT